MLPTRIKELEAVKFLLEHERDRHEAFNVRLPLSGAIDSIDEAVRELREADAAAAANLKQKVDRIKKFDYQSYTSADVTKRHYARAR
jgi:hypothetical protein